MKQKIKKQYKYATKATHKLGDLSRDASKDDGENICIVTEEDNDNFYGQWVLGFGFVEVCFPKDSTRDLTPDEITFYKGQSVGHSNGLVHKIITE